MKAQSVKSSLVEKKHNKENQNLEQRAVGVELGSAVGPVAPSCLGKHGGLL